MKLLHLIRHPAVAVAPGICYGRSDVALVDPQLPQADALRAALPAGTRILSSPAARCRHYAERLAGDGAMVCIDARLQEIDFGDWEMRRFDSIDRRLIDAWAQAPWDFVPPQGESAVAMSLRVFEALRDVLQDPASGSLAIVAHGGPLRVMIGMLTRLPRETWLGLACDFASLTRIRIGDDGEARLV